MKQIVEKLASLERDIASEKGEFSLFALLLREDADDKWDLLASAPWLEANNRESLEYLVNQLRARLDTQELLSLSRIVLLEPGDQGKARHGRGQGQHLLRRADQVRIHHYFGERAC